MSGKGAMRRSNEVVCFVCSATISNDEDVYWPPVHEEGVRCQKCYQDAAKESEEDIEEASDDERPGAQIKKHAAEEVDSDSEENNNKNTKRARDDENQAAHNKRAKTDEGDEDEGDHSLDNMPHIQIIIFALRSAINCSTALKHVKSDAKPMSTVKKLRTEADFYYERLNNICNSDSPERDRARNARAVIDELVMGSPNALQAAIDAKYEAKASLGADGSGMWYDSDGESSESSDSDEESSESSHSDESSDEETPNITFNDETFPDDFPDIQVILCALRSAWKVYEAFHANKRYKHLAKEMNYNKCRLAYMLSKKLDSPHFSIGSEALANIVMLGVSKIGNIPNKVSYLYAQVSNIAKKEAEENGETGKQYASDDEAE